jgi:GntR family transcriptional repressor for pyruvate dehydrogenase complex
MSTPEASALGLQPVLRHKLADTVAQQLLENMRTRGLTPGTRMPSERELQHALGVGRSTIREAVTGLAMMGVVEIRQGEGTFVAADPELIGATGGIAAALAKGVTPVLLEARRPVECEIARLAALRRDDADLKALEAVLAAHAQTLAEDGPAARISAQFHVVLSEAAHNELLAGFVASYRELLVTRGPSLEQAEGYREWELAEHRGLYEAVQAGDAYLATARMADHLDQVTVYYRAVGWPSEGEGPRNDR